MRTLNLLAAIALLAALCGGHSFAQAPTQGAASPEAAAAPLTLDAAIRAALANQNQITIAQSQREAAEARVTQARSAYYPQIAPLYRYNSQTTSFNYGGGQQSGTLTSRVATVGLEQLIYDMGRREQNVARSKDALRSAAYNTADVRQAVILNVTNAWYELRRSRDLVRVSESSAERARTTLEATRAFVDAGSSPRKDVLQAQADFDLAQVQVIQARNGVRLAQTALRNAIGLPPLTHVTVPDSPLPEPPAADARPISEFVARAYENRPDLKGRDADLSATRRSVKLARIDAGPQVTSTLGAGYRIDPDPGNERTLNASVTYPLFDAGSARAGVRAARESLKQAEESIELARQQVAADVESAYLSRDEAINRLQAARTALSAAQENFQAASESRTEGVGTILDVITAQNQLVSAETSAVQAVYDYYTADARLLRAIGDNDPYAAETQASVTQATATRATETQASEGQAS